jgi:hypothetical protein
MALIRFVHLSDPRYGFGLIILRILAFEEGKYWTNFVWSFLQWDQYCLKNT